MLKVGENHAVDVAAILAKLAGGKSEKLNCYHSVVDLVKVLGTESSLVYRRKLARYLGYSRDLGDSAATAAELRLLFATSEEKP